MPAAPECIPFATWMERALFAPGSGYYDSGIKTVGRRGDFSTSATTGNLFGMAVAGWLKDQRQRQPRIKAVIEVGGGDGSLSSQVRKSLGWWGCRSLDWHLVEISPVLRAKQQEKVGLTHAQWHASMTDALDACGGEAFIFHNELVDAFPTILLQWDTADLAWREVWLRRSAAGWREETRPLSLSAADAASFSVLRAWGSTAPPPQKHQRVELHASFRQWLSSWTSLWQAGSMLTVDYGDLFPALYHRRPQGTLRAYLLHQRIEGPDIYQNMGKQDLTADINFTDLQDWGEALGWNQDFLIIQREFLQRHVKDFERRVARNPADAWLAREDGAGGAFKAWAVSRPRRSECA